MSPNSRGPLAFLIGIGYALVGIVFAIPATHAQAWRLAAWAASGVGFAAHIAYELFRQQRSPASAALRVACGAAVGAFGLAVGANVHSQFVETTSEHKQLLLLSLAIWPIMTGLPAFLVALATSMVLARVFASARGK